MEEIIIIPAITAIQTVSVPIFYPTLVIVSSVCSSIATYGLMKVKSKSEITNKKEKED